MNTGWWKIDIHGCYSPVKIAFASICVRKNNRIWRHNASTPLLRDVTDQLWLRHIAKSEKTVLGNMGELTNQIMTVLAELCSGHKIACKKIHSSPWTTFFWSLVKIIGKPPQFFGHSWRDLLMVFTRDFVTREYHWPTASHVTKNVIHGNSYILYFAKMAAASFTSKGCFPFVIPPSLLICNDAAWQFAVTSKVHDCHCHSVNHLTWA